MNTQPYLRPCYNDAEPCELFVVEGKSAADALNNSRSRRFQAVYAMQGKMPNPAKASLEKLLANPHCAGLFDALGDPQGGQFKLENLAYQKVLLLGDADIDGRHSQNLLLEFFQRYFPELVRSGRLYRIEAPSYRLTDHTQTRYLYTEAEKHQWLNNSTADSRAATQMSQLKGIASMSADEIAAQLLTPHSRRETAVRASSYTGSGCGTHTTPSPQESRHE